MWEENEVQMNLSEGNLVEVSACISLCESLEGNLGALANMTHAATFRASANHVIFLDPRHCMTYTLISVAKKKINRAPVTCKEIWYPGLSLMSEKNGITKDTRVNPIRMVELARIDLLLKNAVNGT